MRRAGLLIIGVMVAVVGPAAPALAAPGPTATGGPAAETVCTIADPHLVELSGLVALPDGGYVVENDSNEQPSAMRVWYLDSRCKATRWVSYPTANPARDPEDLAVASDGTLWVADIGDNFDAPANERRETIALWKVPTGGGTPVLYRMAYPDGHHDAEALLFSAGDVPTIVTKDPTGTAGIYQPAAELQPGTKQGVPLKKVGTWTPKRTGTAGFLGPIGNVLVTGAAQSPDRKRFVLRTYSDAYEWDAPDGDVVKAIKSPPRITPLPGEPQGEGISYSVDGTKFLTCSDQTGPSRILSYTPVSATAPATGAATKPAAAKTDTRSWFKKLTLPDIINIVAGVGVLGLILVVVGVIGIRQSRKTRRQTAKASRARADSDPDTSQPVTAMSAAAADPPKRTGGTTYGSGFAQPPPASGGYGQPPASGGYGQPPPSGGGGSVYGGGNASPRY